MSKTIRIGGASGYWGDSDMALPQFLKAGGLDYIVFDYLAEITMSGLTPINAATRGFSEVARMARPNFVPLTTHIKTASEIAVTPKIMI